MGELLIGDAATFSARIPELLNVYRQAFLEVYENNPAQATRERRALMHQHQFRSGLRLAMAEDRTGYVEGFCYTYHGEPGQWWHDAVCRAVGADEREPWLGDCREVVELHVLPTAQGTGLGRRLLRAALECATERTAALSALDLPQTRARKLYASEGFVPLLSQFSFPGSTTRYAILAKQLAPRPSPAGSAT